MENSKNEEVATKKQKVDNIEIDTVLYTKILQSFKLVKVLSEDAHQKNIFVHGKVMVDSKFGEEDVIIILERTPLTEPLVGEIVCAETCVSVIFKNDIYSSLQLFPKLSAGALKSTLIYPASEKHLEKFQSHQVMLIRETAQDYFHITLPHIQSTAFSPQWLYNVLDGETEQNRVALRDTHPQDGFVLIEDLKWDAKQTTNLYLVAISNRRDVLSIRDLRWSHLPMLQNIRTKCKAAIKERYSFNPSHLRAYFHYQPSYYHLHIHFANVSYESTSCALGKSHLLDDVIDRLKEDSDYYAKVALTFVTKDNDPLVAKFRAAGRLEE